jgi:DNA-binding transcriptional regulator YhcF (GntR family)
MFRRGRRPEAVNFSNGCRRALVEARTEAERLGHSFVGTEHILLAVLKAADDNAPRVIAKLGLVRSRVRRDVEARIVEPASKPAKDGDELPYTSRAKKVLELAMKEAAGLGQTCCTVGHLLLALISEQKGIAAQVLRTHGVTYAAARAAVSAANETEFSIRIDDGSDRSIYEQIIAKVREAVATGELIAGERLPAVRELADELDIAPGTVARAYSELERLGVVITEGARGTRVAERPVRPLRVSARPEILVGLLRPVAVAAFHFGASAIEVRHALEDAMQDIFADEPPSA